MVIDKKEHRDFILEMFKQINFPGSLLDLAYEVKKEVEQAALKDNSDVCHS